MVKECITYNKEYDDPYAVLSWHIVANNPPQRVKRLLTNDSLIKTLVLGEARQLDIRGAFLDCVDEEIIKKRQLRQKNKYLKKLGEYYFSELDLPRLRDNIRKFAGELGIDLDA